MQYVSEATYFTDITKFHNIWSPSLKIIAKITHCNLNSSCIPLHIIFLTQLIYQHIVPRKGGIVRCP